MSWPGEPPEDAGFHEGHGRGPDDEQVAAGPGEAAHISSERGDREGGEPSDDLLSEVNAVAHHLRELQRRLGTYSRTEEGELPASRDPESMAPPVANGVGGTPEDVSEQVAAIVAAAESAAAEIRARAEATAAEIVANAESAAARIREEARSDERRLFEAIDALRPAAAEFQHALERVHDAAVAALMSYPRA